MVAVLTGATFAGTSALTVTPSAHVYGAAEFVGSATLTARQTSDGTKTYAYASFHGDAELLVHSKQDSDSTPLSPDALDAVTGRGASRWELRLYRPSSVKQPRDSTLAVLDVARPPRNEPIVFRPSGGVNDYMAPIFCDISRRSGAQGWVRGALITLRWRKGSEED